MKHLRIAVFVTLVVTALLVLQGTTIAPALFSTTQQQRAVEVDLRRQLQVASRELASVQERLELASAQGQRLQERLDSQKTPPAAVAQEPPQPATAEAQRWDETPDHRRLYELLNRVANPRREVMVGLVNDVMMCTNRKTCWWNGGNILETFLQAAQRLNLRSYLIVTLDDETERFCRGFSSASYTVPSLRMEIPVPKAQQGSRGANMISTLKYDLLQRILGWGYSVLVVDLDVVFLKDPFDHLYRDADVEGSTDGFTRNWAMGSLGSVHEPKMGWGAGGLYVQHFTLNVGCAFFRPTPNAIELLRRVGSRLARESGWDQQIFNQELFLKSHGEYNGSKASVRVMDHLKWVNSKVYFFSERRRFLPGRPTEDKDLPVMVHMNYHADKHKRMLCVWARYGPKGEVGACDKFPEGS